MLVVCPNPTRDHQVHLPSLLPGTVSRATRQGSLAGGKPINVARALRSLGARPTLLILLPNHESDGFHASLAAEGLDAQYVRYDGALRTSIILFEENGRVTVVNGPGSPVPTPSWQEFAETAAAAVAATPAGESRWAACSGSLPPGVSGGDVAGLVRALHRVGARIALDVGADWLREALAAGPDLVTPNLGEAEAVLGEGGHEPVEFGRDAPERALAAARALLERGARRAIVTIGSQGHAWAEGGRSGVEPPMHSAAVVNPIGAGDAFLGGVLAALETADSLREATRWGAATAASAISQWIPGAADGDEVLRLLAESRTRQ